MSHHLYFHLEYWLAKLSGFSTKIKRPLILKQMSGGSLFDRRNEVSESAQIIGAGVVGTEGEFDAGDLFSLDHASTGNLAAVA